MVFFPRSNSSVFFFGVLTVYDLTCAHMYDFFRCNPFFFMMDEIGVKVAVTGDIICWLAPSTLLLTLKEEEIKAMCGDERNLRSF